ncbi:MAG: WD40/YVTN/BNR-like repeat-containing protein [Planctomycetota bacterium]|jgi:photosystem II stability/assembly factor-like uncharacterized protein
MKNASKSLIPFGILLCSTAASLQAQQDPDFLRNNVFAQMNWRSIGPSTFSGRVVDIEAVASKPSTYYVAAGSGGLWKTVNDGTSFEPIFDHQAVISIGDLAIAPSDSKVLYVGTGEANNQRSSYWGDGIYKSTDAGKSWEHVGLEGTDHIGRIVVHPENPDLVYVAALGALYKSNEERGLYRSKDGGGSWELVKFISADVGFVDVAMDPENPQILYAAAYERRRRAHHFYEYGAGSAIYKTSDGGDSWEKLSKDLPSGQIGRIGLAISPQEPRVVYALVENVNPAPAERRRPARRAAEASNNGGKDAVPGAEEDAEAQDRVTRRRSVGGELYRSEDHGESWTKMNSEPVGGSPHYYYGQVRVDPNSSNVVYVIGLRVARSRDAGKTWDAGFASGLHVDNHALWLDPNDSDHALIGNDGGLGETWDGGEHWIYHSDLPFAQFYTVAVDNRRPYTVYGGTQDNGSWGIPSRSVTGDALRNRDAFRINGGDGFYVQVDPTDPDVIYSESQFGNISRINLKDGSNTRIRPSAEKGSPALRFNWSSPILISPHNPSTVYFGSQYLHRSVNRGDRWEAISPDLSSADPEKIKGNVPHCTITSIAESTLQQDLLWVGTDDGKVWTSRNGGGRWIDLSDRFPDMPAALWVSRVEASPSDAETAYVSFTGYREDIRAPFLYLTTDGGESFRSIANNLPQEPINVVREHPRNPSVLFVGTELRVMVSVDSGGNWHELGGNLPTNPVHDLLVHPRENDLVIGTHGRGFYIMDISALADMNPQTLATGFHVFPVRDGHTPGSSFPTIRYQAAPGWRADRAEQNPIFRYYLSQDSDESVSIKVFDATGEEVFSKRGENEAGLHEVVMARARGGRGGGFAAFFGGGGRGGRASGPAAPPGQYLLRIQHGEQSVEKVFRMLPPLGK